MAEQAFPQRLAKYTLLRELGRGAYGTVYLARDTVLDVERALKVLHPALVADAVLLERFRREARLAARLDHPHIVTVYDFGEAKGKFYLVMRYMEGGSLKERLEAEGALPWEEVLRITRQVSAGLAYAHEHDVVHRDLKPGNILFDSRGNAAIGDLGFAKALRDAGNSLSLSLSGGVIGTPPYMAPELWRGKEVGPAADQYALACIVVEMLTGQVLFDAHTPAEAVTKHLVEGPALPQKWPEGAPENVGEVLHKALAKEPSERYPDVLAFVEALAARREDAPRRPMKENSGKQAGIAAAIEAGVCEALQAEQWEEAWRGVQALREVDPDLAQSLGKDVVNARLRAEGLKLGKLMQAGGVAAIEKVLVELRQWGSDVDQPVEPVVWEDTVVAHLRLATEQESWEEAEQWLQVLRQVAPAALAAGEYQYWEARVVASVRDKEWEMTLRAAERLLQMESESTATPEDTAQSGATDNEREAPSKHQQAPSHQPQNAWATTSSEGNLARVQILRGHAGGVLSVAFSPDGELLASAGGDGVVRLWGVKTGSVVNVLKHGLWLERLIGAAREILSVAFSPQGDLVASGANDGIVRIWQMPGGELIHELQNDAEVWGIAFSPDGELLAAGAEDQKVRLWRMADGELVRTLEGHAAAVWSVAFSPDGKILSSASSDKTVHLWRVADGEVVRVLADCKREVNGVAFSPDGDLLASGADGKGVCLWRASTGTFIRHMQDQEIDAKSVRFSPDGALLAAGANDGIVRLWRVSDGKLVHRFEGHTEWVPSVAFSPDGTRLASASEDGTIRLWRVPS